MGPALPSRGTRGPRTRAFCLGADKSGARSDPTNSHWRPHSYVPRTTACGPKSLTERSRFVIKQASTNQALETQKGFVLPCSQNQTKTDGPRMTTTTTRKSLLFCIGLFVTFHLLSMLRVDAAVANAASLQGSLLADGSSDLISATPMSILWTEKSSIHRIEGAQARAGGSGEPH
jgi:hypothetical protein